MSNLPLMFYRQCLQCGRRTLTYCNSLCQTCSLMFTLKAIVTFTQRSQSKLFPFFIVGSLLSFVKPPTFTDLIDLYGSAKNAVKNLSVNLSAEEIERRYNIPYHMIQVYLHNSDVSSPARFSQIAELYSKIDMLKSGKGRATEITDFARSSNINYGMKIRFLLGRVSDSPTYIREAYCLKAIASSGKLGESQVNELFIKYGDVGDVALMSYTPKPSTLLADEVYEALNLLSNLKNHERLRTLASLLSKATPEEAKWIARLATRDLKIHLGERTIMNCVAEAYHVDRQLVLEASTTIGVIDALLSVPKGNSVLARYRLRPSVFVKPMLAYVYDPEKTQYPVRCEYKYDGFRLQIHKNKNEIWLYSRRGLEKSAVFPDIATVARTFTAQTCVVDSEIVAVEDGKLLPFQNVLTRISVNAIGKVTETELAVKAFDILYCNGISLSTSNPLEVRLGYLRQTVPPQYLADGETCRNEAELNAFNKKALANGLEGTMIKTLNSTYQAGERTHTWQKLKPQRDTLDCVVLKAFYGHGHRAGLYSAFLLAVRDANEKRLYTIGNVSSLTNDQMITLKPRFDALKTQEDQDGIWVKPNVILEVLYGEIQQSPKYSSGYALRFPNVMHIRDDKTVADIDTLEQLKSLYETQAERYQTKTETV